MKQIITFSNGGILEVTADGCIITSITGEVMRFGADGKLISEVKEHDEKNDSWFKYFFLMGEEEREIVKEWYKKQTVRTDEQKNFLKVVKEAIDDIDYNYRIATIEPSKSKENDRIFYKEGEEVYRGLNCFEWKKKAKDFAAKYYSDLANLYELFIWYAYRIAKGYWTIEYVCDDSLSFGNYWDSPNATHAFEPSGARKVGGFADGVGNTYKIVKDFEVGFSLCGGGYNKYGDNIPVADVAYYDCPDFSSNFGSGVLVLKK